MSITLYGMPLSPYVRKVRWCLVNKALDYTLELVSPFSPPEWFAEISPLGRIPALKDAELTLADSSVICQYLDEKYQDSAVLYGQTVEQRCQVRWLEKYADYELAPLTTVNVFVQRKIMPSLGQVCDEALIMETMQHKLPKHFDYLTQQLGSNDYFVANSLSVADIAFVSQIISLRMGGEDLNSERWPELTALCQRVTAVPAVQEMLAAEHKMLAKIST